MAKSQVLEKFGLRCRQLYSPAAIQARKVPILKLFFESGYGANGAIKDNRYADTLHWIELLRK